MRLTTAFAKAIVVATSISAMAVPRPWIYSDTDNCPNNYATYSLSSHSTYPRDDKTINEAKSKHPIGANKLYPHWRPLYGQYKYLIGADPPPQETVNDAPDSLSNRDLAVSNTEQVPEEKKHHLHSHADYFHIYRLRDHHEALAEEDKENSPVAAVLDIIKETKHRVQSHDECPMLENNNIMDVEKKADKLSIGKGVVKMVREQKHQPHSHEDYLPKLNHAYKLHSHSEHLEQEGGYEKKVQRRCVWGKNCADICGQGGIGGIIACTWTCGGHADMATCPESDAAAA